ncbi:hypothetical protein [Aeromicrobium sp. UC242_57]|uniref:hypothetical protein n=1 Tax=Aeromicrobium sp. UC242_57 TaxID=3374624 RepID=UPI00379D7791
MVGGRATWSGSCRDQAATDHAAHRRSPPPRAWADKKPEAADRLGRSREVVTTLAEQHDLPTENLISPALVRNLAWEPPQDVTIESVTAVLSEQGARSWQIGLIGEALTDALSPK